MRALRFAPALRRLIGVVGAASATYAQDGPALTSAASWRTPLLEIVLLAGLIVVALLVVLLGMSVYQMIMQNGRILARLEAVEQAATPWDDKRLGLEEYVATLPVGVIAPAFSLPDLSGARRVLSEWRGRRVLLVFMDPRCGFSRTLLPSLVALTRDVVPGRPEPVIITTGDLEENRRIFDEAGFTNPVLIQDATEVAGAYKVDGTPMSYLISADGITAAPIAVGIQAILLQAGEMATVTDATDTDHGPRGAAALDATAPVRTGLLPGTTAPVFRLPALDGGEISLLDYRGRNVVIVFSDPECAPCDELAPLLESAHREHPGLPLLMISRSDPSETRLKVQEFSLTFPIALQRHWEISREYGIFANPVAYIVDEWGTIGANVAIGPEGIMDLIHAAVRVEDPQQSGPAT